MDKQTTQSQTTNPLVSVVMAAYNAEETICAAVDSILDQSWSDFELILINDGSTDSTARILKDYVARDSRCVLIEQNNKGLTASLNVGLRCARGKLIARQDADDVSLAQRLQAQVSEFRQRPALVLLGTNAYIEEEDGKEIGVLDNGARKKLVAALHRSNQFVHGSLMFRREIAGEQVFYDEYYKRAQDYDLCLRLAELGEIGILSEPLYRFRMSRSSITSSLYTFYGERARQNAVRRKEGQVEDRSQATPRVPSHGGADAGYFLRCARFALACYEVRRARSFAISALRIPGLDERRRMEAVQLLLRSFAPPGLLRLLRESR